MLDLEKLKTFIESLLEFRGVVKGNENEQQLWHHLYHLYLSAAIYTQMSESEKRTAVMLQKRLSSHFARINVKINQKKRKRKDEKEKISPTPLLIKEKEEKEKEQETTDRYTREDSSFSKISDDLTNRRNVFRHQCLELRDKYSDLELKAFYEYWTEEDSKSGKMRYEFEKTFNIGRRMKRWTNNRYSSSDAEANIRLVKTKQKQLSESSLSQQQQAITAEREDANERLEREIAERKQGAVSYEEYLKMKENKQK